MRVKRLLVTIAGSLLATSGISEESGLEYGESYYRGFSQGAYYGLMLAGEDYHVAWCMKTELEYEAEDFGTGADFQRKMEALLEKCREPDSTDVPG